MKNVSSLRASITAMALIGGCLFAGSAFAQACTTNNWSSVTGAPTADGPANAQARYVGSCSLAVDASTTSYVQDDNPNSEQSYRARFYVYLSDLTAATDAPIFETDAFTVTVSLAGGNYTFGSNAGISVSAYDGWNSLELSWDNTGTFSMESGYVETVNIAGQDVLQDVTVPAVTNGADTTLITFARLGSLDGSATGTILFDDFESRRTEAIGQLMRGNADGNTSVDVLDALAIVDERFPPNTVAPGQPDCTLDGNVNVLDALCVVDIRFPPTP